MGRKNFPEDLLFVRAEKKRKEKPDYYCLLSASTAVLDLIKQREVKRLSLRRR